LREGRIRDLSVDDLVNILRDNGFKVKPLKLGFSDISWVIKFKNYPAPGISYVRSSHRIVFASYPVTVKNYPTLRGLRTKFLQHQLKIDKHKEQISKSGKEELFITVYAYIKDTERIGVLVDTLNAAKYFIESLSN
jgi:hypothetical protein